MVGAHAGDGDSISGGGSARRPWRNKPVFAVVVPLCRSPPPLAILAWPPPPSISSSVT